MSINSIQSNIERIKRAINEIDSKIADKRKKIASAQTKSDKAYSDARKSKSESTIKSKISEGDRCAKEAIKLQSEIASLETAKTNKNKELIREERALIKEQQKEATKQAREYKKSSFKTDKSIGALKKAVTKVQLEQERLNMVYPLLTVSSEEAYDVFISHASEDKADFVDALENALSNRGVKVWYDRKVLTWGKSIRHSIDSGLRNSKYAIVVLSEPYTRKYWTQKEFNALFALGSKLGDFILPIWHKISKEQAQEFSPMLCDAIAIDSSEYSIDDIADMFVDMLNQDSSNIE